MMNIKILKSCTQNLSGKLTSYYVGQIVAVEDTVGAKLIADGMASLYKNIIPTGTKNITANGTYDVTEFATATVNSQLINVVYNSNNGEYATQGAYGIAGSEIYIGGLPSGEAWTAPDGKEFTGWATEEIATEPEIMANSIYTLTNIEPETDLGTLNLYAVWGDSQTNDQPGNDQPGNDQPGNDQPGNDEPNSDEPNEQALYEIRYNHNDGTGNETIRYINQGDTIGELLDGDEIIQEHPTPEVAGKRVVGWTIDEEGTQEITEWYEPSSDITLYAKWEDDPNTYTVSYNDNREDGWGEVPVKDVVDAGSSLNVTLFNQMSSPPDGKEFEGWAYNPGEGYFLEDGGLFTPSGDVTLYAVYKDIENL